MTILSLRNFGGEIPRLPPDRLPDGAAQFAENCDFTHGELRSLHGLGAAFAAGTTPVRGLFTDDGLRFFCWSKPTRAYLHPTIGDTAGRVIYQEHGQGIRVALAGNMKASGMSPTAPTQSWKAGVLAPSAPVLDSLIVLGGSLATSTDGVSYAYGDSPFSAEAAVFGLNAGTTMVLFGSLGSVATSADNGTSWVAQATKPLSGGVPVASALYGGTVLMAVGAGGTISTSDSAASSWTVRSSGIATDLHALTYSGALWVVAGAAGKLLTSADSGATWTSRTAGFGSANAINDVHFADGLYVAVGDAGKLSTSTNGTSWTTRTSGFDASTIRLVCKFNGAWLIAGDDGKIATSADGLTWTLQASPFGTSVVRRVAFAGATWIALADAGQLATSTDNGVTWTSRTLALGALYNVAHTGTQWVLVGEQGVATSPDGAIWTKRLGNEISAYTYIAVAPSGVIVAVGELVADGTESVAIVAVAVNIWGEESAPSAPLTLEKSANENYTISVTHTPDPDEQALQGIAFYRTYASFQSADFYLLNPTPLTGTNGVYTFTDSTAAPPTTTTLRTADWDRPPTGAASLTYMGNGFFMASVGKDLVLSEPYRPHAWPYRMTLPHGVVGIVPVEGGALVTTQAEAYLVSGAHPSQVSQQFLGAEQAGWSDTALTRVAGSAVYASNDGFVDVFGGRPSLESSQHLFTRRDWRDRFGAVRNNLRLASHDGRVLGFIDPTYPSAAAGSDGPFLIDLHEAAGSYCRLDVGQAIYGAAVAAVTDELFVGTATGFAPFGSGAEIAMEWQSADFLYPAPQSFAAAIVDCAGSFTIELRADGVLVHSEAVTTGRKPFRLPDLPTADRWSVKFVGTGTLRSFDMAGSFRELGGV